MKDENKKAEIAESVDNENNLTDWVLNLTKPIMYNGEEINELHFDFAKLTGRDAIEIESELQNMGKLTAYSQVMNINYIIRVAARACSKAVGIDIFADMAISDFNVLRNRIQLFLINIPS